MFAPLLVPDPEDERRAPKGRDASSTGRAKKTREHKVSKGKSSSAAKRLGPSQAAQAPSGSGSLSQHEPDRPPHRNSGPGPGPGHPDPDLVHEPEDQPDLGPIFELAEARPPSETLRETGPPSDGYPASTSDADSSAGQVASHQVSGIGTSPAIGTGTNANRDERARAVAEAINTALQGRVVRVGTLADTRLPTVSSGFPALDRATGMEGFPRGRITEIIGRPTSGRGTVATRAVAAAGGYNAWVDVSGCLDVDYLARSGVDLNRLFVLRPKDASHTLGIAAHLMASGHFTLVVLDAVSDLARMTPSGLLGQELSRFTRVVTPALARTTTAALLLSGPEHHFRSLAHAATLRVALAQAGALRRGGVLRGWRARATVLKSPGLQGGESGLEVWLQG